MKQFKTLIKVKTYEEIAQIEELSKIDKEIYESNERINYIKNEIEGYKLELNSNSNAYQHISARAIISSRTQDIKEEEKTLLKLYKKREDIHSTLSNIRKEIKSVEKLLEKKQEELYLKELYKEQEMLDELNTIEC